MKKEYHKKQKEPLKVEEPKLPYGVKNNSESSSLQSSKKARIIENTVSVDEFFDDLISLVRSDYESIWGDARRLVSHNRRWIYIYHIEEDVVIVDRIIPAKMNKG